MSVGGEHPQASALATSDSWWTGCEHRTVHHESDESQLMSLRSVRPMPR